MTMTVRQAFTKAYGPVPLGTFHLGLFEVESGDSEVFMRPVVVVDCPDDIDHDIRWKIFDGGWDNDAIDDNAYQMPMEYGPDIQDRPARSFMGFFGQEYDTVCVDAEVPS